jgi:phage terminase Nu1 subunit (DNA packaging protein)
VKPRRVLKTRAELAVALGITAGTLTRWERDGCPVAKKAPRGRPSLFDEKAVRAWRDAVDAARRTPGVVSLEVQRARLAAAQAARVEQQNRVRAGELIEVAELERTLAEILATLRARLLAIPSAMAETLARETDPRAVHRVLTETIHDALAELATWRPPTGPDPTDDAGGQRGADA